MALRHNNHEIHPAVIILHAIENTPGFIPQSLTRLGTAQNSVFKISCETHGHPHLALCSGKSLFQVTCTQNTVTQSNATPPTNKEIEKNRNKKDTISMG